MKLTEIEWPVQPFVSPRIDPVLQREVKQELGVVPGWSPYLSAVPWLHRANMRFHQRPFAHLEDTMVQWVDLVVSMDNSCRYCYGAVRSLLKLLGYSEEVIRLLEEDISQAALSERKKFALQFARKVSRCDPRPARADLEKLQEFGFGRTWIAELVFEAAGACFANRISTLLAIPPDPLESIEQNWMVRAFKPITARIARYKVRRRKSFPIVPFENTGPGKCIVDLLQGSPSAFVLRSILDEAWQSELTSRRLKSLIFAMVAKSAGCALCEQESTELLHAHGVLSEEVSSIFRNLSSKVLSESDLKVIHFARETVHYQVPGIHRKISSLRSEIPPEMALDVCGLAALANCMVRLGILASWEL